MLALALGGRTVQELQASMSRVEFLRWRQFYLQAPFDDLHRYHRPAALIAARLGGGSVNAMIDWLQPAQSFDYSLADLNTFKAFGFKPPARE